MPINEMRKDYLLNRWVVIAARRKKRPTDFVKVRERRKPTRCPFCPGNESMTPPATLVYLKRDGGIIKEVDKDGLRHKNWIIRCVPNLYPAFTPPAKKDGERRVSHGIAREAYGHHEVIIESPNHDEHPGSARLDQLIHVIHAYIDRFRSIAGKSYVRYISIFRNHGADAGASLSHAHTQLIATPIVPRVIMAELRASRKFWVKNGRCIFCEIIKRERESSRFIWGNDRFLAFAPWASVHPFEFWIFPRRHQPTILHMNEDEIADFAEIMRVCLGALKSLLGDPSYNFGFHMIQRDYYHWHVEVYPRLAVWAGFEKSTGMYINVMPPEEAAENLREAAFKEERLIH